VARFRIFATPVVRRELQRTGRTSALYTQRTFVAALAIVVGLLCIIFSRSAPASAGRMMFNLFAWGGFILCLLEGARSAADAISSERREGTLGLLFLTDVRTHDVVLGKLTFVGIRSFILLLPILPALAVPLLLGGVTIGESMRVMFTLVVTVLFALAAGLFASALSVSFTASIGKTALILLPIALPLAVSFAASGRALSPTKLDPISGPLGMLMTSTHARFTSNPTSFLLAATLSIIGAVAMVAAAAYFTHRNLSFVRIVSKAPWWRRWLQPRRGYVPPWGEGSEQSPAVWLAEHTLPGRGVLWLLVCLGLAACLVSGLFGAVMVAVILQVVFGIFLKLWITVVAPQSLHDLRKSGALELILCTPLQPPSIVRGQLDLLYESVIGPALAIAIGFPLAVIGGTALLHPNKMSDEPTMMVPLGMIWFVYLIVDLHALGYLGMWHGVSSNRIEGAIGKTAWYGLVLPWLFAVVPIVGWAALLFWPLIIMGWASKRLNQRLHKALIT
jgi:hypothetical protein